MKTLTTFIFLLLIGSISNACADQVKAKAYYIAAEVAYNNKQYKEALDSLDNAKLLLGSDNARILALKVKIHYAQYDYFLANALLEKFYKNKSSTSLQQEMSQYFVNIEKINQSKKYNKSPRVKNVFSNKQSYEPEMVLIDNYAMSKFEITQGEWLKLMGI